MSTNQLGADGEQAASQGGTQHNSSLRRGWLRLWFLLDRDVGPGDYAITGFVLMAIKYAIEAGLIYTVTGNSFSPTDFLNPLLSVRRELIGDAEWLGWFLFFWTLPFVWVAFSMTVRRAANAGWSPWLGLLVLIPGINYALMLWLSVRPTRECVWSKPRAATTGEGAPYSAAHAIFASLLIGLAMVFVSVFVANTYGASLFIATPLVMGATAGFIHNRRVARSFGSTLGVAFWSVTIPGIALLIFALEGAICLVMAAPIVLPLGLMGGMIGKAIADCSINRAAAGRTTRPGSELILVILALPALAGAETLYRPSSLREVETAVEIAAPPERVWRHVVSFPELAPPREWYFRAGIACPTSAWIDGTEVGAVRHCVFSTGEFVEPITTWDEPRHLAFDVTEQPDPMRELSPFGEIHPPHLDGNMRSRRGEFRLIALPTGRTRLEGRTWYELEMFPQGYWTLISDAIVHRIHRRVLDHIQSLCETE
jgi:uncharacterized membrane protein YhaH (DUF805 family)